jgi:hypothetical protein
MLKEAVPEPPRGLDGQAVLRSAKRRQFQRRGAGAAVVAAAVAVALTVSLPRDGGTDLDVADVPLTIGALADRVPLGDTASGAIGEDEQPLAHPGEGSLVGILGDYEVWLLERADGELCLMSVAEKLGAAGVECIPRSQLLGRGVISASGDIREAPPLVIMVALPDGYTRATAGRVTAHVRRNVAMLAFDDEPPAGELSVSGPAVPRVSFSLANILVGSGQTGAGGYDAGAGEEAKVRLFLAELARRADGYRRDHGTVDGFLAALPADRRAELAGPLATLTDESASARVGHICFDADLRTANIFELQC